MFSEIATGLVQLVEPLTLERVQFPGTDKYRPGSLLMSSRHEKFYQFTQRILIRIITMSVKTHQKKYILSNIWPSINRAVIKIFVMVPTSSKLFSLKTSECLHIQESNTYSAKSLCPVPCTTANKSLSFSREEPLKYNSAWSLPDTENE